jgi:hypothetical protein
MRHLGKVSIALVILGLSACNMYGDKPTRMRNPVPRSKTMKEIEAEKEAERQAKLVVEVDECNYTQTPTPPPAKATTRAADHERAGDAKTQVFKGASNTEVQRGALIDVIDEYGRALAADPFNPDLTLKLADAYDKAQRRGCALALLGRLAKMSNNPKYSKKADLVIDSVVDGKGYFPRYRKDAIRAVGR